MRGKKLLFIRFICITLTILVTAIISSCVVKPKPLTFEQRKNRVNKDWHVLFSHSRPIKKPITMYDAMARALKYNLDIDVKNFQALLSNDLLHTANFDMWPQIIASTGYLTRNNINASFSFNVDTGSLNFGGGAASSEAINRTVGNLEFSWNILDFGLGYLTAKQQANSYLASLQQYRSVMQHIIRDVRFAYWRALTAQQLERQLTPLLAQVHRALHNSRTAQFEKLIPVLSALHYRQSLYEVLRHILQLQQQLVQAKSELAALMNLPDTAHFTLAAPSARPNPLPRHFPMNLKFLEKIALFDRPELREEDYQKRISLEEVTKARLQMVPGLEYIGALNADNNNLLLHNTWASSGIQLTWDVLKLFSGPYALRAAKTNSHLVDFRRLALSMVAVTQVDIAYRQYYQAQHLLEVDQQLRKIANKIYQQTLILQQENKASPLDVARAAARRTLADLRYNLVYAQWQNTVGQLLNSIGYDAVTYVNIHGSISAISQELRRALNRVPHIRLARRDGPLYHRVKLKRLPVPFSIRHYARRYYPNWMAIPAPEPTHLSTLPKPKGQESSRHLVNYVVPGKQARYGTPYSPRLPVSRHAQAILRQKYPAERSVRGHS